METAKLAIHKSKADSLDGSVSLPDKAVTFGRALKNGFLFDKEYRNLNHGISSIPYRIYCISGSQLTPLRLFRHISKRRP